MDIRHYLPTFILIIASLFFLYDIITDILYTQESMAHIIVESFVFIAITIALYLEIKRTFLLSRAFELEKGKTEKLSGELFKIINQEFNKWGLTASEKEIALLIVKGLSMKEISELRNVKEKTIRQQSIKIYSKSGYSGRNELASHFIQDLLDLNLIKESSDTTE